MSFPKVFKTKYTERNHNLLESDFSLVIRSAHAPVGSDLTLIHFTCCLPYSVFSLKRRLVRTHINNSIQLQTNGEKKINISSLLIIHIA